MSEIKNGLVRVDIIESERGWGSKVDERKYFSTPSEGTKFVKEYNEEHNPPLKPGEGVPDWYMYADGPYPVTEQDTVNALKYLKK